jgi:glycosyltransferase involved in cell wall biosynthesis
MLGESAIRSGKISIAMCTYNGARFLPAQIESFLAQSRLPDEVIVCDDGSIDDTAEIVRRFAEKAPFAVHLHINEKNLGSTKNFEKAIGLCTGDLIFLSDQDDIWLSEKIARIEATFLKNKNLALIFSDAELVDEGLDPIGHNLWSFTFPEAHRKEALNGGFFDVLLRQNAVTGATMAFRSEYREMVLPIPDGIPNLIHDAWIALVIANSSEIGIIDEPLIRYRQHPSQQLGLGIGLIQVKTYDERRERYSASITFLQNEIKRLGKMKMLFQELPLFEKRLNKIYVEDMIEEKKEIIRHYTARKDLTYFRGNRVRPVLLELFSGRYHRFSKGVLSAAKDLIRT